MSKPISLTEAALPLLTRLALLTVGGLFLPIGTELLVFIMFIAAAVAGVVTAGASAPGRARARARGSDGTAAAAAAPAPPRPAAGRAQARASPPDSRRGA